MARVILDACILIAAFNPADAHHATARGILETDDDLHIHPLNLAEVLVGPARTGRLPAARHAIRALRIQETPAQPGEAERLALLRAETGLQLPDCCVLAAARAIGATTIATTDARLATAAAGMGFTVLP